MTRFRQEKDRPSAGTDEPVETKNLCSALSLGYSDRSVQDRLDQDTVMFRAGYRDCYQELMPRIQQLENSLRWYINRNVAGMFHSLGFDGAAAARERSEQRFWKQYRERDVA